MTWRLPFARRLVESSDAFARPLATGFPREISGGHACAQAPEQRLRLPVSFSNR